jgi:hypothetical protein
MTTQILLTHLALENVAETGIDPADDVCRVATAGLSRADLLAECLDGADDDRVAGWREYVDAVVDAAHAQLAAEVARKHLQAIGWTLADGTHDSALGLGDSWGSGESTGLDQGEWSELCVRAVRRVARELYASTEV